VSRGDGREGDGHLRSGRQEDIHVQGRQIGNWRGALSRTSPPPSLLLSFPPSPSLPPFLPPSLFSSQSIFYHSLAQKEQAEASIKEDEKHRLSPIVTQVVPATTFYEAEVGREGGREGGRDGKGALLSTSEKWKRRRSEKAGGKAPRAQYIFPLFLPPSLPPSRSTTNSIFRKEGNARVNKT